MKEKKIKKAEQYKFEFLFTLIIFVFFYIFYLRIRPIAVTNIDDWSYISYIRKAVPNWKEWNPTKVLPETLTGIVGSFAVYVILPLCRNYTMANTFCFAFVTALCISLYVVCTVRWVSHQFDSSNSENAILAVFFITIHFLIFKTKEKDNSYMFSAINLTCYMNYLVPLICSFLFFIWWDEERRNHKTWADYSIRKKAFWVLIAYVSVFSNMVTNIAIVLPVTYWFLQDTSRLFKDKVHISKSVVNEYLQYFLIAGFELVVLVFEYNGGRASSLECNWPDAIKAMAANLAIMISEINIPILILICGTIMGGFLISYLDIKKDNGSIEFLNAITFRGTFFLLLYCSTLSIFYTILLFTRVGLNKILRSENRMVMFFFIATLFVVSLGYIFNRFHSLLLIAPVLSFILVCSVLNGGGSTYEDSTGWKGDIVAICESNDDIINQFIVADRSGKREVNIIIRSDERKHWCGNDWMINRIGSTLYTQGIIHNEIYAHAISD